MKPQATSQGVSSRRKNRTCTTPGRNVTPFCLSRAPAIAKRRCSRLVRATRLVDIALSIKLISFPCDVQQQRREIVVLLLPLSNLVFEVAQPIMRATDQLPHVALGSVGRHRTGAVVVGEAARDEA